MKGKYINTICSRYICIKHDKSFLCSQYSQIRRTTRIISLLSKARWKNTLLTSGSERQATERQTARPTGPVAAAAPPRRAQPACTVVRAWVRTHQHMSITTSTPKHMYDANHMIHFTRTPKFVISEFDVPAVSRRSCLNFKFKKSKEGQTLIKNVTDKKILNLILNIL